MRISSHLILGKPQNITINEYIWANQNTGNRVLVTPGPRDMPYGIAFRLLVTQSNVENRNGLYV